MTDLAARISRLGTESAFEVLARVKALEGQGRDIINLGIGQPDFKTPDHIVEAAIKALRDGHHGYTPAAGIAGLRQAVCADIAQHFEETVAPEGFGAQVVTFDRQSCLLYKQALDRT